MSDSRKELETVLWAGADVLRSKMDANEYKDYLLSFVFYKYLSDTFLVRVYDLLEDCAPESMEQAQEAYEEAYQEEDAADLLADLKESCRYIIEPHLTFTALAKKANNNEFNREELKKAFNDIETSDPIFNDLFADVDLYSSRLGVGDTKQSATVAELVKVIDQADVLHAEGDVLGNAYEYLIGEFASETGKKAGEFYTPAGPAEIVTRIAISGQEDKQGLLVYDPCMGSASMLLDARKFSTRPEYVKYFGQELMMSTYNLARMNMFLHGIAPENQHLRNGDTLDADWPTTEETEFDMVVMNPPYSANWSAKQGFLSDSRYSDYGELAPKSKADYAFLLHGFYHLKPTGTMAIVLPHGVLFRGASEATIRQKLLENGSIYAVIGLPVNMFYNTGIPTCIIVLKKQRKGRDVLFIDGSKLCEKKKTKNVMNADHIRQIMQLYTERKNIGGLSYLAPYDEIKTNCFNLNIPKYIDTFEKKPAIQLPSVTSEMTNIEAQLNEAYLEFSRLLGEIQCSGEMAASLRGLSTIWGTEYLSQGIFPQPDESMPKMRFSGFVGEWETRKLKDIARKVTEKNTNLLIRETFTNSAEFGVISQQDFFDHEIANQDSIGGYYIIRNDDFVYNPRISVTAPVGPINRNKLGKDGVMSPLYTVFRTHDIDPTYLEWYFKSDYWHTFMYRNGDSGARFDRFSIKDSTFFEMPIPYPTLEEQKKIGLLMNCTERIVCLEKRRYDLVIDVKRFMLQNMFA